VPRWNSACAMHDVDEQYRIEAPRDGGNILVRNRSSFTESAHRRFDAKVHVGPLR
jgi:hypothetical protein